MKHARDARSAVVRALAACALSAGLMGCAVQGNERVVLGDARITDEVLLHDLAGETRPEAPAAHADVPSLSSDVGLSRAHWDRVELLVPVDGTWGTRTYARTRIQTDQTARQRGDFPTPVTSLELTGDTLDTRVQEALLSAPYAVGEAIVLPVRMLMVSPVEPVLHTPPPAWRASPAVPRVAERMRDLPAHLAPSSDAALPAGTSPSAGETQPARPQDDGARAPEGVPAPQASPRTSRQNP